MYCSHCGAQLPEGSVFCPRCGSAATTATERHEQRGRRILFAVVGSLAVVAIAVALLFAVSLRDQREATRAEAPAESAGTPAPVRAPGWEDAAVRRVCLRVLQSHPDIEGQFTLPILETAREVL